MCERDCGASGDTVVSAPMRGAVFGLGILVYGIAQILATLLAAVGYIGGFVFLLLNAGILWAVGWAMFGLIVVFLAVSLLRLPFVLFGWVCAAVAGRTDEYMDFVRSTNDR